MSNFNFKARDKVYYPRKSNKILTTENNVYTRNSLLVGTESGTNTFATNGKQFNDDSNPSVFPATQEWYEKLVQIYPDLEAPKKCKKALEIIEAMLESGWYRVPVFADGALFFVGSAFYHTSKDWQLFYPIDLETGKAIIDFVDGKVVLES